jgi:hypothetical protein
LSKEYLGPQKTQRAAALANLGWESDLKSKQMKKILQSILRVVCVAAQQMFEEKKHLIDRCIQL